MVEITLKDWTPVGLYTTMQVALCLKDIKVNDAIEWFLFNFPETKGTITVFGYRRKHPIEIRFQSSELLDPIPEMIGKFPIMDLRVAQNSQTGITTVSLSI